MSTKQKDDLKSAADQKFAILQSQLQSRLSIIHAKRGKLKERKEHLLKRREAMFNLDDEGDKDLKRQRMNDNDNHSREYHYWNFSAQLVSEIRFVLSD